jgi:hypothetical protein
MLKKVSRSNWIVFDHKSINILFIMYTNKVSQLIAHDLLDKANSMYERCHNYLQIVENKSEDIMFIAFS